MYLKTDYPLPNLDEWKIDKTPRSLANPKKFDEPKTISFWKIPEMIFSKHT